MEVNLYENLSINSDFGVQKPKGMLCHPYFYSLFGYLYLEIFDLIKSDQLFDMLIFYL